MTTTERPNTDITVAVLGTGIMGAAMARNLVETGQLLILASGPEDAASEVAPAFSAMARKTVWLGEAGHGREDVSAARLALGR